MLNMTMTLFFLLWQQEAVSLISVKFMLRKEIEAVVGNYTFTYLSFTDDGFPKCSGACVIISFTKSCQTSKPRYFKD